ncbi:MAG: YraN family protein [Planctomycetes bacterium]|nr:YraN family protein [Planctomycetota bacterium]
MALGAEGETRAALYLEKKGYRIEDRNVRAGGVEMDLVARRRRLVVFIEVKTRRTRRFGPPEMAVDAAKRRRLVRGAHAWLSQNGRGVARARFDVISWQVESTSNGDIWHLRHLEGAFEADE